MKRNALRLAKEVLSSRRKRADGGTDDWQSTGKLVSDDKSINWGDTSSAADFFRADKELQRLRDEAAQETKAEPAPKRTAEGRQMAPARVAQPKAERTAAPAPAQAPARTAEGRQVAAPVLPEGKFVPGAPGEESWDYQEPFTDEQRKAFALQQWKDAGEKGTPESPVIASDIIGIKAPSPSFGKPSPNAPSFADAQGIVPRSPEWQRASFPQEGGGKYTNRVAPLAPVPAAPEATPTETARQPLNFGPMPGAPTPAPAASSALADQVWQRMIKQESGGKQFDKYGNPITSKAGALGMAQIMPGTGPTAARLAGLPWSLDRLRNDPEYNQVLGRAYYDAQLRQFGSPALAAAAYNAGPGRVTKAIQLAERNGRPFTDYLRPETRNYVRIVTAPSSSRIPLRFGTTEGYAKGGRTGYADEGAVVPQEDGAVYDAMGNVAVPSATTDPDAKEGLYDTAMKKVGEIGERIGAPITRGLQATADDYRKNLERHSESAGALQSQASKDSSGERGWQGRLLAPIESANAMLGTGFAPVSAAASTIGHGATYLTGNPAFGERAELLAGLADPSHIGMAKGIAMKAAKAAEDLSPYSAMFVPVARADPALATAKQLLAEGKTASEIKEATGVHFGPENDFGSYELTSNVPNEFGRYERQGEMPLQPESRPFREISDENLSMHHNPSNDIHLSPNDSIKSYTFEHPELQRDFPELASAAQDIKVHPSYDPSGAFYAHTEIAPGQWGSKLEVRAPSVEEARSVAAHELQHFVAEKGGLEQGNSPQNPDLIDFHSHVLGEAEKTASQAAKEMDAYSNPIVQKYAELYNVDPNTAAGLMEFENIRQQADLAWWTNLQKTDPERAKEIVRAGYIKERIPTAYDMYQHTYGEALARATQDRLNIPKAERDQRPVEFNFNEYQGKGQPDILTPIQEENLFSNKNMSDYRNANSGFVYSSPSKTKKDGGTVDENVKEKDALSRAMDISRFGTDAVQSAVNLARQHRGRPDS